MIVTEKFCISERIIDGNGQCAELRQIIIIFQKGVAKGVAICYFIATQNR